MVKPFLAFAAALMLAFLAVPAAHAQASLSQRLANERLGTVRTGAYQAGDHIQFMLDHQDGHYLLRFAGDPEVFVLHSDHASLGGRVLKYDSGETVLQIAGWGGVTLYTDDKPGGIPAERTGDSTPPLHPEVTVDDIEQAARDEAAHLAAADGITLTFRTHWNALANNGALRALCYETLENTAHGIDRFADSAAGRQALAHLRDAELLTTTGRPTLHASGKQLIVTYNPNSGYAGRASSRAIVRTLDTLFHVKPNPN